MAREDHLITAAELARALAGDRPPVLLDVRWTLGKPEGRDDHDAGHLPGAIYVSLDASLSDPTERDPKAGRHPLPTPAQLEATIRGWGVTANTPVVAYDDNDGLGAARAWWLLRWAGVRDVRVLDGGLAAWRAAGQEVSTTPAAAVAPSGFTISAGTLPTVDADEVAALARTGTVLDARAPERYRGDVEPMDPQAGHIPGARNAPTAANVVDGRFRSADELREHYASVGALRGDVAVYCGSGVTACHDLLALATIGVDAALFPASWSGWSNDPSRPVATGDAPA